MSEKSERRKWMICYVNLKGFYFFSLLLVFEKPCALAAPTTKYGMLIIIGEPCCKAKAQYKQWREI
jgi:hypothetical protein